MASTLTLNVLRSLGQLLAKDHSQAYEKTISFVKGVGFRKQFHIADHAQAYLVEKFPFQGDSTFKGLAEDALALGSYHFLKFMFGRELCPSQTETPAYSAFVPLLPQGYKKYAGIKYSQWSQKQLISSVSLELNAAITALGSVPPPVMDSEYLAERQEIAESSSKGGLTRVVSPRGSVNLENRYANCMYYQTWLAHPEIIHPDMLFSFTNPDKILDPCVEAKSMLSTQEDIQRAIREALAEEGFTKAKGRKEVILPPASNTPPWEA